VSLGHFLLNIISKHDKVSFNKKKLFSKQVYIKAETVLGFASKGKVFISASSTQQLG
jgi:hypothetical protein